MADIIDAAQEQEQLIIAAALSNRPRTVMTFIGQCYWCGEKLAKAIAVRRIMSGD
jgi:hypothetical protein